MLMHSIKVSTITLYYFALFLCSNMSMHSNHNFEWIFWIECNNNIIQCNAIYKNEFEAEIKRVPLYGIWIYLILKFK